MSARFFRPDFRTTPIQPTPKRRARCWSRTTSSNTENQRQPLSRKSSADVLGGGCFSYFCFGINEFAAHLPVAAAMFLLVLLAMRWGRRAFGDRAAIYAGLFVATTTGCYLFTRILIPEAILSFLHRRRVLLFRHRIARRQIMALVWRLRLRRAGGAHQGIARHRRRRIVAAALHRESAANGGAGASFVSSPVQYFSC